MSSNDYDDYDECVFCGEQNCPGGCQMIPDPIERGESRCEDWYFDNVENGIATCSCGNTFKLGEGETLSDDPYAIPVCGECFEKYMLEKFGECP